MKFNLLLLMWLALMAGFTSQTAQAAAASPETQVTLQESFRQVRAKGRRVLLRDDKPKKERSALLRIFNIIGAVLVIGLGQKHDNFPPSGILLSICKSASNAWEELNYISAAFADSQEN